MQGKATRKPIAVRAMRYTENTDGEGLVKMMREHTTEPITLDPETSDILIHKDRGIVHLTLGNWLLYEENTDRAYWAIDHDIFGDVYETTSDPEIFTKRPVELDYFYAEDLSHETVVKVLEFIGVKAPPTANVTLDTVVAGMIDNVQRHEGLQINTLEGVELLHAGEYLMKGVRGEHYPVTAEISI